MTAETVLAFDFGERRIGVAVGNSVTRSASALTVLDSASADERMERIAALIQEWQPARLVVGQPLSVDGHPTPMTQRARKFADQLHGRFKLPVERVDERYSSIEADQLQRERRASGLGRRGEARDALAATVILLRFFEANHVA